MQPIIDRRFRIVSDYALRDLVLMVRKFKVDAAGMDIERHPQCGLAHGRAFNVPARTARQSLAVQFKIPVRLAVLAPFPKDKILDIFFFIFISINPGPGPESVHVYIGKLPIFMVRGIFGDIKIHRTVFAVSVAGINYRFGQNLHFFDIFPIGGMRHYIGLVYIQFSRIIPKNPFIFAGKPV